MGRARSFSRLSWCIVTEVSRRMRRRQWLPGFRTRAVEFQLQRVYGMHADQPCISSGGSLTVYYWRKCRLRQLQPNQTRDYSVMAATDRARRSAEKQIAQARASKSKAELKAHSTALDHMVDESARKDWDSGTLPLATQRVGGTITTYLNLIKHGATRHLH